MNKSVLIGWAHPDQPGNQLIESYHVYVDGVLKVTVKAGERTRALVEGVDLNRVCIPIEFQRFLYLRITLVRVKYFEYKIVNEIKDLECGT